MSAPSAPIIPPRPSKSPSKEVDAAAAPPPTAVPSIPARPAKKVAERAISPNPARFAQSPLREGFSKGHKSNHSNDYFSSLSVDPIARSASVDLPSVGQEGMEYGAIEQNATLAAIHQTSVVSDKLELHAPKPGLSPETAKDRVAAVTRTDSDKAASLGFGRPTSSRDRSSSRQGHRRQPSSTFSVHSDHEHDGIPEIGQRVPIARHLGDVQAPSPDVDPEVVQRHHQRRHSARNLPPGSYGLHGHGEHEGNLHKAYYDKHPELRQKEHVRHHERANDFSMSKNDLNRLVRDTANRPDSTSSRELIGTPTDDLAFQAADHQAYRMIAPNKAPEASAKAETSAAGAASAKEDTDDRIHIDDSNHAEFYGYGGNHDDTPGGDTKYHAPILASDEMEFGPEARMQHPAIHAQDRTDSFDADIPTSRSIIRPPIIHRPYSQPEFSITKLDDVKEYDPLFPEESTKAEQAKREAGETKARRNFPSKDIWEDAPSSVHYTVEVSTPDVEEEKTTERRPSSYFEDRPITPARAFAQYHEELAEKEAKGQSQGFLPLQEKASKPTWIDHQSHLAPGKSPSARRFPSKDIWEDAPESHIHETTVSEEQEAEEAASAEPEVKAKQPPTIPDRPKPQMPTRPVKRGSGDASISEAAAAKPKPPVPARPAGSKIAALQAGFMSDLNKRLQLGPQAPKKDEPKEEEPVDEEKAPLADARKSRARGPQRRAPTTKAAETKPAAPVLAFSSPQTLWSINPEDSSFEVASAKEEDEEASETKAAAAPAPKQSKAEDVKEVVEAPTEEEPVEAKLTEANPTETKPTDAKPTETKPTEAKPTALDKTTTKEAVAEPATAEPEEE